MNVMAHVEEATVKACAAIREAREQLEDWAFTCANNPAAQIKLHYARKALAEAEVLAHKASGHVEAIAHTP